MEKYQKIKEFWGHIYKDTNRGGFLVESDDAKDWRRNCEHCSVSKTLDKYGKSKGNLLDVGCGDGNFSFFFAEKGFDVLGMDISEYVIEKNIDKNKYKNLTFKAGNIVDWNSNKKFDVIFIGGVFTYVDDQDAPRLYAKLKTMLKKDGIMIVREPVSFTRQVNEGMSHYRNIEYYINLDKKCLQEYWLNECAVYHVAYSQLKQLGLGGAINIVKPVWNILSYLKHFICNKPRRALHYYIFKK